MFRVFVYLLIFSIMKISGAPVNTTKAPQQDVFQIVPRSGWKAKPPRAENVMQNPVPFVVLHYSYTPGICRNNKECVKAMQWMQQFHQEGNNWTDIGYNFGIGSDGVVYTGRGWTTVGAHAPGFNNISVALVIIGDWRYELPPKKQMQAITKLIQYGLDNGHIAKDYNLFGHRQVRATDCPGERLFREIKTWEHFCTDPFNCKNKTITIEDMEKKELHPTIAPEH